MCIAIAKMKGRDVPSETRLKNCWEENPDGAGFAFNDHGNVRIVKGLMTWETFKETFEKYNKKFNFKERGVLIHFRIETHGGVCPECTHPFPISSDEGALQKTRIVAPYAVVHNGIISLTSAEAHKKEKMSDTMVFVQKYLTKIASFQKWFYNPASYELIYDLVDSKIAILNGRGDIEMTYGFTKDDTDGIYYSNTSYKYGRTWYRYSGKYGLRAYGYGWGDDYDEWGSTKTYSWSKKSESTETKKESALDEDEYESAIPKSSIVGMMKLLPSQTAVIEETMEYPWTEDFAIYMDVYGREVDFKVSHYIDEKKLIDGYCAADDCPVEEEPEKEEETETGTEIKTELADETKPQ